jgi:biotin operon repressor
MMGDDRDRIMDVEEHPLYHLVKRRKSDVPNGRMGPNGPQLDLDKAAVRRCMLASLDRADEFAVETIVRREEILSPWFRSGSLGYIFGLRGSGKTWFAWKLAISVSKGEGFGPWACGKPWKVLYVDGEMPRESMQERLLLLDPRPSENLHLLSHEALADGGGLILNVCRPAQQDGLLETCLEAQIRVVFLDNLSCLCFGMKENEADDWEQVLGWLLNFRRSGIAVVIIHHANRDGNDMRGTSRREDAASWVLKISRSHNFSDQAKGTTFSTTFTKNRDDGGVHEKSLDWAFVTTDGSMEVHWRETQMKHLVYDLIQGGVDSCSEIADVLGISKGAVSKVAAKLSDEGLVEKRGKNYFLP